MCWLCRAARRCVRCLADSLTSLSCSPVLGWYYLCVFPQIHLVVANGWRHAGGVASSSSCLVGPPVRWREALDPNRVFTQPRFAPNRRVRAQPGGLAKAGGAAGRRRGTERARGLTKAAPRASLSESASRARLRLSKSPGRARLRGRAKRAAARGLRSTKRAPRASLSKRPGGRGLGSETPWARRRLSESPARDGSRRPTERRRGRRGGRGRRGSEV